MPDPSAIQAQPSPDPGITPSPPTETSLSPAAPAPAIDLTLPPPLVARNALLIVFLVVVVDLLGFGIVLPLLPLYGERYVAALVAGGKESHAVGAIVGLLMASFSAMQFLFAPIWGRISDRQGRRPILLLGLVGSVVFYLLLGYASDLPVESAALAMTLLFVARLGAGLAGATIATAQAVIADCTPPERRKVGMALIGAAFGIGFTIGPLVGAGALYVLPNHPGSIGYTAAILSFVALLLGISLLPETRRPDSAPVDRKWFNWRGIRLALSTPAIGPVVLTFFLATLGFGSFEVTLALFNKDSLELPEQKNVLIFAYVGFVLMLTQGVLYRRLAKHVSEATFMALGMSFMAAGVASLGGVSWAASTGYFLTTPSGWWGRLIWVLLSLTAAVVGFAFLTPSAQALISRRTDPNRQGEILGVNQSASAPARILGPICGLTLYHLSPSHLLPYAFGALLLALMLPMIPRIRRG